MGHFLKNNDDALIIQQIVNLVNFKLAYRVPTLVGTNTDNRFITSGV